MLCVRSNDAWCDDCEISGSLSGYKRLYRTIAAWVWASCCVCMVNRVSELNTDLDLTLMLCVRFSSSIYVVWQAVRTCIE